MQLHSHLSEIESKGAKLYMIGNGAPSFIEGFKEDLGYSGVVFTDPSRKSYQRAGLLRSVGATFGFSSIKAGLKSMKSGHRQTKTQGDVLQQGGALVISQESELLYYHRAKFGGDNVHTSALIAVL